MEEQKNFFSKNKIQWIVMGIMFVTMLIVIILLIDIKKENSKISNLTNNLNNINSQVSNNFTPTPDAGTPINTEALKDAKSVVPGASPINKDNVVLTVTGQVAKNDAKASSPDAPRQSSFLNQEQVAEIKKNDAVIKLEVGDGDNGWNPNTFTVNAGSPVTVSVTNLNKTSIAIFGFSDSILSAVAIGTEPGTTRAITFNAPSKTGEYTFVNALPGRDAIDVGKMIVK